MPFAIGRNVHPGAWTNFPRIASNLLLGPLLWQTSQSPFSRCVTLRLKWEGNQIVPLQISLIHAETKLLANSDGESFDISASASRTFLCILKITDQIEQESLDVSIWGSADGQDFGKRPLLKLPQQFYRGTTKIILDLSFRTELKFLRAKWELNRWGRVAPTPMFVASLDLEEIPPMSRDTSTKRAVLAPR
jgi:hypothetical protein